MTLVPASSRGSIGTPAVTLTGTPTAGQVVTATSATAADWATPGGLAFTGWTEDNASPANVASHGGNLDLGSSGILSTNGVAASGQVAAGTIVTTPGITTSPQTSGALVTATFSSGTGASLGDWDSDVNLFVPWTTDATLNAATLKVELSPDNVTYSTVTTLSVAAALNTIGALTQLVTLYVPRHWFVKLTAVHCTIGTATGIGIPD